MNSLLFTIIAIVVLCHWSSAEQCSTKDRQVNIVNNCDFNVWVGGWWSHMGTNGEGGAGYLLQPGRNNFSCVPEPFNGRFWARTGCNFNSDGLCPNNSPCCSTGNCVTDDNKWGLICGQPGVPPVTIAEFTMIAWGTAPYQDYYDVSLVDGANIPMEITPITGTFTSDASNPYWCGAPGCTAETCDPSFTLDRCSWNYDGGNYTQFLQMVEPRKCSSDSDCPHTTCDKSSKTCKCASNSDCGTGEVCGSTFIAGVGLATSCGQTTGWYGAGGICALNPNLGEPLNCNEVVPGQGTRTNLYQCNGPNALSCASHGAQPTCCGCPPWEPAGTCINENPQWIKHAQPATKIFKDACPTAYSFPYDDMSSTFVCRGNSESDLVGYTITFCPSGSPNSL